MPSGAAQLIFLLITSGIATYVKSTRIIMMIVNCLVAMVGYLLVYRLSEDARVAKMTGLCLGAVFAANIPLSLSLITSNVAGMTKKSTVSAMLFIAYCVGNIVGPQFYLASEEPTYEVCPVHSLVLFIPWKENTNRNRLVCDLLLLACL